MVLVAEAHRMDRAGSCGCQIKRREDLIEWSVGGEVVLRHVLMTGKDVGPAVPRPLARDKAVQHQMQRFTL